MPTGNDTFKQRLNEANVNTICDCICIYVCVYVCLCAYAYSWDGSVHSLTVIGNKSFFWCSVSWHVSLSVQNGWAIKLFDSFISLHNNTWMKCTKTERYAWWWWHTLRKSCKIYNENIIVYKFNFSFSFAFLFLLLFIH